MQDNTPRAELLKNHMQRLKESGYFKDYYQAHKELVECPHCLKNVQKVVLPNHQKTKYCKLIQQKKLEKNL